jgi:hypothetical protein
VRASITDLTSIFSSSSPTEKKKDDKDGATAISDERQDAESTSKERKEECVTSKGQNGQESLCEEGATASQPQSEPEPHPKSQSQPQSLSSQPQSLSQSQSQSPPILHQGYLIKMNRDGDGVNMLFTLTSETLTYTEPSSFSKPLIRTLRCDGILTTSCPSGDLASFCVMSKTKSFVVHAESPEIASEWIASIGQASRSAAQLQSQQGEGAPILQPLKEEDCMPILNSKKVTSSCPICTKTFGFFDRRHHCRNCGKCVCDTCSREKVRIIRLDPRALFKVCTPCANHIKDNRQYGVQYKNAKEKIGDK